MFGRRSITSAAKRNDTRLVMRLLRDGADVNECDVAEFSMTALHWASRNGHLETLDLLLLYDVDVDVRTEYGYTGLLPPKAMLRWPNV